MCRKICEQCGREFEVYPSRKDERRFCSKDCYADWRKENWCGKNSPAWKGGKIVKVCEQCGKEFEAHQSEMGRRFCSKECHYNCHSENLRGENHKWWKPIVKLVCEQCGKEYERTPSHANGSRFCSNECKNKWASENGAGENSPRWKPKVIKKCDYCGIEFEVVPSRKDISRFCSRVCRGKWHTGKNNHNWNDGSSFEPYCHKFNEAFKESVREKFDRVCFLCPTTEEENSRKLSVHHISYNKDCLCNDSDCEFVPLCMRCHSKTNHDRDYWENLIMEKLNETNTIF